MAMEANLSRGVLEKFVSGSYIEKIDSSDGFGAMKLKSEFVKKA